MKKTLPRSPFQVIFNFFTYKPILLLAIALMFCNSLHANTAWHKVNARNITVPATNLRNLYINECELNPSFDNTVYSYTGTVDYSADSIHIKPKLYDNSGTVAINGAAVAAGDIASVALIVGDNTITVDVPRIDGSLITDTYTLHITRLTASSDATLAGIVLSEGYLSPVFDPGTLSYSVTALNPTFNLAVSQNDYHAVVTIKGDTAAYGSPSADFPLNLGPNIIPVIVRAEDGSVLTYTITVTRIVPSSDAKLAGLSVSPGTLSPAFDPAVNAYTVSAITGESITLTPTQSDTTATFTINDKEAYDGEATPVALHPGSNIINIKTTAQDGTTTDVYTINVNRLVPPAPTLSYSGPNVYAPRIFITPLTPNATGADVPGYGVAKDTVTKRLTTPTGISRDAAGNIYVADIATASVYKIPVGGGAAQLIGDGYNTPIGVAADAAGNVYVADLGDTVITRIPAGGGARDTVIRGVSFPTGIAVDAAGSLYIGTTFFGPAIYKYPAGGGPKIALDTTTFSTPYGIALDAAGNIYVADANDAAIRRIPAGGGTPTTIGTVTSGSTGIAIDSLNNVYAIDVSKSSIKKFPTGGGAAITIVTGLSGPFGLVLDNKDNIYVSDNGGQAVEKITPVGGFHITPALPPNLVLNDTTGVISGNPGVLSPAKDYTITTYNSGGSVSATVNIAIKEIAELSSLTISKGTLSPAFNKDIISYTAEVDSATNAINITPVTRDTTARIKINGTLAASGAAYNTLLNKGDNTINTVVTALDNSAKTYTLTIHRSFLSNDATISKFAVSGNSSVLKGASSLAYLTSVDPATSSLTLTPTSTDPTATITVNGVAVDSGTPSGFIPLDPVTTVINVVVTAADGITIKNYTVTVSRTGSNNAALYKFVADTKTVYIKDPSTGAYSTSVDPNTSSLTITPTTKDPNATVTVNGVPVVSDTPSGTIMLSSVTTNITITVTAQNGVTTKNYKIIINRTGSNNASINKFTVNNTSLVAKGATSSQYITSVDPGINSLTLTPFAIDPNASIAVNGFAVAQGAPSQVINLTSATTVINVTVTAQDGSTSKSYTVTVTKAGSNNASLFTFKTNTQTVYTKDPVTGIFSSSVDPSTSSLTLTPIADDPNATIKVNGTAVVSGTASLPIPLTGFSTTVTVDVTAQDGVTTKTYLIQTNKSGSNNISVVKFAVSTKTTVAKQAGTSIYNTTVPNTTIALTLTTTLADANATVRVNGTIVPAGAASGSIILTADNTDIDVLVTAQDNITTHSYTVKVTKATGFAITGFNRLATDKPALTENTVVKVNEGVSPNGDGINDVLTIDNIAAYPNNKLSIMNLGGTLVYQTLGYDNNSKAFNGRSTDGTLQKAGTYYYLLEYKDGDESKRLSGYIILRY